MCVFIHELLQMLTNVQARNQTIVTPTLYVTTLRDRMSVAVLKDIKATVKTAQVNVVIFLLCQSRFFAFIKTFSVLKTSQSVQNY